MSAWHIDIVLDVYIRTHSTSQPTHTLGWGTAFLLNSPSRCPWGMLEFENNCNRCYIFLIKESLNILRVTSPNLFKVTSCIQEDPCNYMQMERILRFECRQTGGTDYCSSDYCPIFQLPWSGLIHKRIGHNCWRGKKRSKLWAALILFPISCVFCHSSEEIVPPSLRTNRDMTVCTQIWLSWVELPFLDSW